MTGLLWQPSKPTLLQSLVEQLSDGLLPSDGPYAGDPVQYASEVLRVNWWSKQQEIAQSVARHPITMVRAAHSVGKTFLAGSMVNWHFDQFNPGITITTAPTARQVSDLLWKEVRLQRRDRRGLLPRAPRLYDTPNHYAAGFTAQDATSFQGTHEERLFIVMDEAVGIDAEIWEAMESMLTSGGGNRALITYNPTDTGSAAYEYESRDGVNVIEVSILDHPNIKAEAAGEPRPYPQAISLAWFEERILDERWATPVLPSDVRAGDIEYPEGSGNWYRPGPLLESRALARWPSQAVGTVWSQAAFSEAITRELPEPDDIPEIGCDVARYGDDSTAMHVRRGPCSIHHESHNGWSETQTAGRLIELAGMVSKGLVIETTGRSLRKPVPVNVDPKQIPIKVDDAPVGGGVVDILREQGYNVQPIKAAENALEPEFYPNRRSELWFAVAHRALERNLDLTRLPYQVRESLRRQFLAPRWKQDSQGRRVVEQKDDTKKRIGRSPDDADAVNLAYSPSRYVAAAGVDIATNVADVYGRRR